MTAGPLTRSYWPALDGLRGLAILLVVVAHAGIGLEPVGGQVGVTLFFVLSGFLITSILIVEKQQSGTIVLRRFYGRRARRLLPALCFFLVVSGLIFTLIVDDFAFWASTWPGLFYVSNYAQVFDVDVFANTHLWSLSVEEHFYAFWPLILLTRKEIPSSSGLFSLAVVMIALRLGIGAFNPNWAYHGTLTNSYALLIGCAIAVAPDRMSGLRVPRWIPSVGIGVLVLLSIWPAKGQDELLATGVWLPVLAAIVSGVMLIALLDGRSFLFEMGWLRYMGRISYGWYLWHAPFLFIAVLNNTAEKRLASVVGTFGVAAFSWHVVEKRFLRYRHGEPTGTQASKRTGVR